MLFELSGVNRPSLFELRKGRVTIPEVKEVPGPGRRLCEVKRHVKSDLQGLDSSYEVVQVRCYLPPRVEKVRSVCRLLHRFLVK